MSSGQKRPIMHWYKSSSLSCKLYEAVFLLFVVVLPEPSTCLEYSRHSVVLVGWEDGWMDGYTHARVVG